MRPEVQSSPSFNLSLQLPLVLVLTHDSPSHTQLIPEGEEHPLYTVTTSYPEGKHPRTRVTNSNGDFIASLEWRPVVADLVTFGDEHSKPMRISKWMDNRIFKGQSVTFKDSQDREYKWRGCTPWGDNPKASIELYALDNPKAPIVTYYRPPGQRKTSQILPWEPHPKLTLLPRAREIQDLCVVSWLFLEKGRRSRR